MTVQNPIIIVGMHRSGTTLLSKLLEKSGLFIGARKESNYEAWFFLKINAWLLEQSGGAWDHPQSIEYLLQDESTIEVIKQYLEKLMASPRAIAYLGWKNYLKYKSIRQIDFLWGWKDPRNSLLLPLWLELFPQAKVIHIYRNGIDIASSIVERSEKSMARFQHKLMQEYYWLPLALRKHRILTPKTFYAANTSNAIKLRDFYMSITEKNLDILDKNQQLTIKYEDFLASPQALFKQILDFIGIELAEERVKILLETIDTNRAFAYKNQLEGAALEQEFAATLAKYGY